MGAHTMNKHGQVFSVTSNASSSVVMFQPRVHDSKQLLAEESESWIDALNCRMGDLVRLPEGWDGYSGIPVKFQNAHFAMSMLEVICTAHDPSPQIVPGSNGDLQIEWHLNGFDIELYINQPNKVGAWRKLPSVEEGEERTFTTDFTIIAQWIRELTSLDNNEVTAA